MDNSGAENKVDGRFLPRKSSVDLEDYLSRFASDAFISECAAELGQPSATVQALLENYANEARYGYSIVERHLDRDKRILEVGAGIGVLASFLYMTGYQISAIEPSGMGFDLNKSIGEKIKEKLGLENFRFLDLGVEDLTRSATGVVDLIYSINVLEHLPDLDVAFEKMRSVLAKKGIMLHTCPNYHVPYEPHFGTLLVPFTPSMTRLFLEDSITESSLWHSLNFINSTRLRRICRQNGLTVEFRKAVMYESLNRLRHDRHFAARHTGIVKWLYVVLKRTKLIELFPYWPAALSTPMTFTCRPRG